MSRYDDGMAVRREVLGDEHVDRATEAATDLTRDFQELITEYAWGSIWTRPGLDRRSRSMITLTALVARGHHEELAMHLRAARTNGLTVDEIKEVLLQTAIYCGVPDANTAFRIAQAVLDDTDHDRMDPEGETNELSIRVRRGADAVRPVRRRPGRGAPRRPRGGRADRRAGQGARPRPRRDRRRRLGQRQRRRRGQPQRRPDGRAARRPADVGAGDHREPALRLVAWTPR